MNNRSGNVDLSKFLASLLVMACHLSIFGIAVEHDHFSSAWIFVEFFLIITGYFTAKHYDNSGKSNKIKESIIYTVKKFLPLFPYVFIVSTLQYVTNGIINVVYNGHTILDVFHSSFENFVFDILLLSETYTTPLVGPLWYLSALLIVFPLFSYFVQLNNRYWILFLSFIYPVFYYGITNATGIRDFPHDFLRVFAGLCLGAFVYQCLHIFKKIKVKKSVLTAIEIVLLIFVFELTYSNKGMQKLIILCFVIYSAIAVSQRSFTSEIIRGKFIRYLGKLSMPIYIFHWYVGSLIQMFGSKLSNNLKIVVFYCITILVSAFTMYLIDNSKWYQKLISTPIKLEDKIDNF